MRIPTPAVASAKSPASHASVRSDSSRAKRPPWTEESLITSSRVRTATPTRVPATLASGRAGRHRPGQSSFRASRAATAIGSQTLEKGGA